MPSVVDNFCLHSIFYLDKKHSSDNVSFSRLKGDGVSLLRHLHDVASISTARQTEGIRMPETARSSGLLLQKLGFKEDLELVTEGHTEVRFHPDNGLVVRYPNFRKEERVYSTFFPLARDGEGVVHGLLVIGNSVVADDPDLSRTLRKGNMTHHGISSEGAVVIDPVFLRGRPPIHVMKAPNALLFIPTIQMHGRRR